MVGIQVGNFAANAVGEGTGAGVGVGLKVKWSDSK